MFQKIKVLN